MRASGLLLAFSALVIMSSQAAAQARNCAPWPAMRDHLAKRFGEVPIGGGLVNENAIVRVLSAPDGRSFTIVVVRANGIACMIAAGSGWEPGVTPIAGRDL